MPIYALGDDVPDIDPTAFVHPEAVLIGRVHIGPESTVWAHAVLRGDGAGIVIGAVGVAALYASYLFGSRE